MDIMPGRKTNHNKNFSAHRAWMEKKKVGRPKQVWELDPQGKYKPVRYRVDSGQVS